jgi:mRNA interferase RelE/StbE
VPHKAGIKSSKGAPASASSKANYKLLFHPEALEEWRQLDNSVREPLKKLLAKRLVNPHLPGGELHPPLSGCYKIKLKKAGVRLVYAVEDHALVVYVLAVDKREDSAAYASAGERTSALAAQVLAAAKKK